MSQRLATVAAYRLQVRLWCALVQTGVAGVVVLYLSALLDLDPAQWRELCVAGGVFALGYTFLNEPIQRRIDRPVVEGLAAEAGGALSGAAARQAFAGVAAVPFRMFLLANLSWVLAGIFVPSWIAWRLGGIPRVALLSIASAAVTGGFLSCLVLYFLVKRALAPLWEDWAGRIEDPVARGALVRRVPLAAKLGVVTCSVVVVTVFFAELLAYTEARRPVERHATRVQRSYLERTAHRIAGPGDPALDLARADVRELGIAQELLLVEAGSGRVVDGPAAGLSAGERRFVATAEEEDGDSTGLDSDHGFAWVVLPDASGLRLVAVTPDDVFTSSLARVQLRFAGVFVFAFAVAVLASWLLARDVGRATTALRLRAARIADGDLRDAGAIESDDELGDLARDFERMARSLGATVARVAQTAERVDAAAAEIAGASESVSGASADQVRGIEQATTQVASIHRQVHGITESAQVLNGNVEEASSSILELGAAGEELNQTASALSSQIDDVSGSIEQMIRSVRQIADNTEGLASEVAETAASMSEMAASMREVEENANETARLSGRVVDLSEGGRRKVQQTISGMDAIRDATETVAGVIRGLGGRIQEIGAIVDVIDDVADETNLLALNAAIIAAQAGDQGRAFSVVADEIKDLADRVLSSTKEIGELIRAVQSESANASESIERSTESVHGGVELSAEAGVALEEITEAARRSGERIQEIVVAVREQATASSHVTQLMERVRQRVGEIRSAGQEQERGNEVIMRGSLVMRDVAQQTHRTTEEQSRGARRIRESIESVRDAVDRIHGALQGQSEACRSAVSFLEQVFARTRSNDESATRMSEATRGLREQAQALREDVRRFRV